MTNDSLPSAAAILSELRALANPDNVAGMARYGISTVGTLGVTIPQLRGIERATRTARRADPPAAHVLAADLWASGVHEARILAALLDVPALVTPEQADAWGADLDSWDVCDLLCGNLLDQTEFAYEKAEEWAGAEPEFVKRAGFVLMCGLAVHDKAASDEPFEHFLSLVEREADDERPFVKKAVNWALRQIGKRDRHLHARAVEVGERLRDSGSRAARWVASDALRELRDPKTIGRLKH
ncbi:MAG TPA: DNA alkylation repair protein [Coriobacteriia bacterium]